MEAVSSIREYENIPGVTTFLVGKKLNRLGIRDYLGEGAYRKYFGAFATDDGIVAYSERAMDSVYRIKARHYGRLLT